jgi:hypothetical protein
MILFTSLRLFDVVGLVALSGCAPDRAVTFFCFAKRKSPKKRRAGFVGPALRYGHAALLGIGGKRRNSLRSNICASFSAAPCATRLLMTAVGTEYQIPRQQGRAMARPCGVRLFGSLCRVAGLSSAAAGGSGRALFERSEFSPTPPDASSARYPAGALTSARLLFAYFLLAKQEKVSAPPGAHPGNASKPWCSQKEVSPTC